MTGKRKQFLKSVYERHNAGLVGYVRSLVAGNTDEAEEIVQTVYARFSALDQPQCLENPQAFLYTAARNLVIDRIRRRARESRIFADVDGMVEAMNEVSPEQTELSREALRIIEKTVADMPPRRQRVFILSRVHGLSYDQVAKEVGISPQGVQKHIIRALAECRKATGKVMNENRFKTVKGFLTQGQQDEH